MENLPIGAMTLYGMKQAYLQNPSRLKVNNGGVVDDLKGFRINVSKILEIINRDPGVTICDIFVMLGVRIEDLGKPPEQQSFTIAFAGIDDNNQLRTELIFDYCDPCPDKCPIGY